MIRRCLVFALLGSLVAAGRARATEEKIHRSDLPAAVERTVTAQHADAEKGFSMELENGRTLYEAELVVNGRSKDIVVDSTGTIIEKY